MSDPLRFGFGLPFDEAIAAARRRVPMLPDRYYGAAQDGARRQAFTVSRLSALEQIKEVKDSLTEALKNGQTLETWRRLAMKQDWALKSGHLSAIYRTNAQTAYMAGQWESFKRHRAARPFLMYSAINDSRTRPSHMAMNGYIAPIDANIWKRWTPPCGYNCRCGLVSLSGAEAEKRGYGKQIEPSVSPDPGFGGLPDDIDGNLRRRLDARLAALPPVIVAAVRESMALLPDNIEKSVKSALGMGYDMLAQGISKMMPGAALYEQVALRHWTQAQGFLNHALRCNSADLETLWPVAVAVMSFLEKAPVYDGEVYRTVSMSKFTNKEELERFLAWHHVGEVVQYNGFTAASRDENIGQRFPGKITITIVSRTGRQIGEYSTKPEQMEVLFGIGTKFLVESRIIINNTLILRLSELADQSVSVPPSHVFRVFPGNTGFEAIPNKMSQETAQELIDIWTQDTIDAVRSQKKRQGFIEQHGLTPAEIIECCDPFRAEKFAQAFNRPVLMTEERIAQFIAERGEHPYLYVARVFKNKKA
ncbi:MAG: phage minor head protein [Betaproteobacteria bacterium]|nr:phage minor head protein [Betaproteobacteria bacterium]